MQHLLNNNNLILMEAAIVEQLRRFSDVKLHEQLVNSTLIYEDKGQQALSALYSKYIDVAEKSNIPFLMCTPTWRANKSRVFNSNVSREINIDAAHFMSEIRRSADMPDSAIRIGGMIGCKNDCYLPSEGLSAVEAEDFHSWQINQLASGEIDFLIAVTLPNIEEASGIARAMEKTNIPYIISFVIDRYGLLLDGTNLITAINRIDSETINKPVCYMVNCAYPLFLCAENQPKELFSRLAGFQANASSLDHCDLNNSKKIMAEKTSEWGDAMLTLNRDYDIKILGGCCGTGVNHLKYLTSNNFSK